GYRLHAGERVGHSRVLRQLELDLVRAGALTQHGEQSHPNLHEGKASSVSALLNVEPQQRFVPYPAGPREGQTRRSQMRNCRRWAAAPIAVVCMAAVVGCGSSSKSSSGSSASTPVAATPTPAADPAVEKLVPAAIKSKGTLTVASDASYAPNEFI